MTVSTEVSREEYSGNGVTTDFDYRFRVFSAENLVVSVADTTETITILTLNTDYTVTGAGSRNGGKVKLMSPLSINWKISIERALPVTQETDIRNQGNFFPEVHEDAFDKLTMLIQQVWSYFGLALRKPTWLAKFYDALGNRIANLGNPINAQDAATKSYVDSTNDNWFKRTLRVPESYVSPVPSVDMRRNMIAAYNDSGDPISVLPESGSAADVLIELAKPTGAKRIGFGDANLGEAVVKSIKYFGAVGDGIEDDTAAFLSADVSGEVVRVTEGIYKIKNATLGGDYVFDDGAIIYGLLDSTDNIVIASSGLRMKNPQFIKELINSPIDGDYGNAIRIGTYRQPNDLNSSVSDIKLYDVSVVNIGSNYCQSIEILGNAYDILISGFRSIGGSGSIICHWGGDVGVDGHSSTVTYSYHPHGITLENLYFSPDMDGHNPDHAVIISACYDVYLSNLQTDNTSSSLWVMPGDVYDQVAIPRDKGKVCTGIAVDGVFVRNPIDGDQAIYIDGVPKTVRTPQATKYGRDYSSSMSMSIDNVNITCQKDAVYSTRLVLVQACSNINLTVTKTGADKSPGYWAQLDYNRDCCIKLNGVSTSGPRARGNTRCAIETNGIRGEYAFDLLDSGCRIENLTTASSISVNPSIAGATFVNVTSTTGNIIFNGAFLLKNGEVIAEVLESSSIAAGGSSNVKVSPTKSDFSSGDTMSFVLPNTATSFSGHLRGFQHAYRIIDGWGFSINSMMENSAMNGFFASGYYAKDISISNCNFSGNNSQGGGGYNINVTSDVVSNLEIVSNEFDVKQSNSNMTNHIHITTQNHSGVLISNNKATGTSSGVSISMLNSSRPTPTSMQQIFGNSFPENATPNTVVTGQYFGSRYFGHLRIQTAPTSGYFEYGTRIYHDPDGTNKEGLICTTAGSPGGSVVWKAFGVIS